MRYFIVLLASPILLVTATLGAELTGNDPNSSVKPVVPSQRHIRPRPDDLRNSLDILIDGKPVRVISYNGREYLPVPRRGAEYEIRVNNKGSHRIAAIVSVDGLSVIKGDPAAENSPGYLVGAHSNLVIKGWRRDKDKVAAFTFEDRKNSYAYLRGYRENIGVIGLIAIEEQTQRPRPRAEFSRGMMLPNKAKDSNLGGTGTGWGRDIGSEVRYVPFVRSANKQTVTIYYDTEDALRRMGVPVDTTYPKPFPALSEFCPPPIKAIR